MAETKPTTANKSFQHDGKPVFVLIPQNSGYSQICRAALEDQISKLDPTPEVCTELKVRQLPPDCILYVMHPVKDTVKDSRGKARKVMRTHLSAPIDVFRDAADSNKKGYRTLNQNLLVQLTTKACKNDPAGMFFRGSLTSESTKHPDSLLLKITEQ